MIKPTKQDCLAVWFQGKFATSGMWAHQIVGGLTLLLIFTTRADAVKYASYCKDQYINYMVVPVVITPKKKMKK